MNDPPIIDLKTARRVPPRGHNDDVLAEMALTECERAYRWSDWERFRYWHAVYLRARRHDRQQYAVSNQLPNRGAADCRPLENSARNRKRVSAGGTAMHYGKIALAILALFFATPVPAQVPSWSSSDHANVIAATTLQNVAGQPTYARLIGGTLWSDGLVAVSSADGFFYQISGTIEISLDGQSQTLVAGSALYIPSGVTLIAKAVGPDHPSVYLQFLLSSQTSDDTPELSNVSSRELYRSPYPVPGLKEGAYVLDLIRVTVPHLASWDAPHHRSGMAMHCVLEGVGAESANGVTRVRGPGTISFEPSELVYQWSNPGNAPLTYLVFNLNPENEQPVIAEALTGVRPQ
jgi:hypothetical protein